MKLVAAYLLVFNRRRVRDNQNISLSDLDFIEKLDQRTDQEEYNSLDSVC